MAEALYTEAELVYTIHGRAAYDLDQFNYGIFYEENGQYIQALNAYLSSFHRAKNNKMKKEILSKLIQITSYLISIYPYNYYFYWQHAKYLRYDEAYISSKRFYQKAFILMRPEFVAFTSRQNQKNTHCLSITYNMNLRAVFENILRFKFTIKELIDPIEIHDFYITENILQRIVFEYATLVWKMKNYACYETHILYLLSLNDSDASYLNDYAHYMEYQKEDYEGALSLMRSAIANDNETVLYKTNLCRLLVKGNQLEEAEQELIKLSSENDDKSYECIDNSLGLLYQSQYKLVLAKKKFIQAIRMLLNKPTRWTSWAYYHRYGCFLFHFYREYELSIKYIKRSSTVYDCETNCYQLAVIYFWLNKYGACREILEHIPSLYLDADDTECKYLKYYYMKAKINMTIGDYKKAKYYFSKCFHFGILERKLPDLLFYGDFMLFLMDSNDTELVQQMFECNETKLTINDWIQKWYFKAKENVNRYNVKNEYYFELIYSWFLSFYLNDVRNANTILLFWLKHITKLDAEHNEIATFVHAAKRVLCSNQSNKCTEYKCNGCGRIPDVYQYYVYYYNGLHFHYTLKDYDIAKQFYFKALEYRTECVTTMYHLTKIISNDTAINRYLEMCCTVNNELFVNLLSKYDC